MKRVIVISLVVLLFISLASAANAGGIIQEETGINPEVLKDPEQLKEEYLKQNWADLISKNKVIGPMHNFFIKISPIFKVLFGQPYSLSIALLIVIIFWFYVALKGNSALRAAEFLNTPARIAISTGVAIILAQLQVFSKIANFLVNLVISPTLWWMRLLMILVIVVVAFIVHYLSQLTIQIIRKSRERGRELTREETLEETKEFIRGVKRGQKFGRNLNP